eukprot:PhF_6_TR12874/c0_g1_i1/m.20240
MFRWILATSAVLVLALGEYIPKESFFSNDDWASDTGGTFPGTVLFGQHQTFPCGKHIDGDNQPHVTAERPLLVLFKPESNNDDDMELKAKASDGTHLVSLKMKRPSEIPKQSSYSGVDPNTISFVPSLSPTLTIQSSNIPQLSDPSAVYLTNLLNTANNVTVSFQDQYWVTNLYLPSRAEHHGKNFILKVPSNVSQRSEHDCGNDDDDDSKNSQNCQVRSFHVIYTARNGLMKNQSVSSGTAMHFKNVEGRWVCQSDVVHNTYVLGRFWSAFLPKDYVKAGMSFEITQGPRKGTISNFQVGAAAELLLHTIDLGFLLNPREQFRFANESTIQREYFQRLPVSKMIVSQYETLQLTEIMFPDGRLITSSDSSTGSLSTGDMLQWTGKALISLGINNANYGIFSSEPNEAGHPYVTAQITLFNSIGYYAKQGAIIHGGTGGNGTGALYNSTGTEFSKVLGLNFGLSTTASAGMTHGPPGQAGSTWGYDSDLNMFLPNFKSIPSGATACCDSCKQQECVEPFKAFSFEFDPMAGGSEQFPDASRFPLHTGRNSQLIQNFFESKAKFAPDSSTGFKKWSTQTNTYQEYIHEVIEDDIFEADSNAMYEEIKSCSEKPGCGNGCNCPQETSCLAAAAGCLWDKSKKSCGCSVSNTCSSKPGCGNGCNCPQETSCLAAAAGCSWDSASKSCGCQKCSNKPGCGNGCNCPQEQSCLSTAANCAWNTTTKTCGCVSASSTSSNPFQTHPEYIASQFEKADVINVNLNDNNWIRVIEIPSGVVVNKILNIEHNSSFSSKLIINGQNRTISMGQHITFKSDGKSWNEITEPTTYGVKKCPSSFGVPVTTLVGYYDPDGKLQSYAFPALHGSHGYVYNNDVGNCEMKCKAVVTVGSGQFCFRLKNMRLFPGKMNKFHVNVPQSERPSKIAIVCNGSTLVTRDLKLPHDKLTTFIHPLEWNSLTAPPFPTSAPTPQPTAPTAAPTPTSTTSPPTTTSAPTTTTSAPTSAPTPTSTTSVPTTSA